MTEDKNKRTKIDDNYFLGKDSHQVLLQRRSIVNKGENKGQETFVTEGYHGTVTEALTNYSRILTREAIGNRETIEALLDEIKIIEKKIEEVLGGY